ncbi:branched-chain amino acid ABC transporter permease [Pseudovibrio sp. Tun.PSC04-5.I4]|uniref:branched-chain amino acid ABC transporter permease n=1 Tax=Pseudovibrio sp. Tun.PSC04-5.I4 TaxID=1798213 RepID=UPI000891E9E9|nr:branched-chain amino acid ABC transporter permease [Pseudovibrio sp. Tun.PSC04-5.I4]SDR16473.1 amino acid/amide ABC transporter membrane protein 1, HAAT family [Pseudovibrio sp. Tun.PSC04-5.I4]
MSDSLIKPRIERPNFAELLEQKSPLLLVPVLMLIGFSAIGSSSTWLTLTAAGLAMGMMIFIMASGLTVIFGLMDVINFGHGAFISLGAFAGFSVLGALGGWIESPSIALNLGAVLLAIAFAMLVTGLVGYGFERVIVKPVYGHHLKQILVTMGGLVVTQQIIYVIWGPDEIALARPAAFQGSFIVLGAAIEKYRILAIAVGLLLFAGMRFVLVRTKIGLLVRAGVQNGEMVEALGYPIQKLFLAVFMVGCALAGLGGVMWGMYQETITAHMGSEVMISVFIVVIIGGLGSIEGCFIGAMLVGLLTNYTGYLVPKLALVSTILLMGGVLMWRPQGLYPVVKTH